MSKNIDLSAMFDRVTRFQVIDDSAGEITTYRDVILHVELQDDMRTLKVFVQEKEKQ